MSKIAWNDVDWTIVQKRISRQQRRVYKASKAGNKTVVQALQRRIIGSLDAKLLAVRQLTTRNIWCNNAGVETISHNKKIELAYQLKLTGNISSLTKTYIPKFEKRKYYPFNIPNYAKQMLTKFALEPEWEAIFESNSYGSRPGKSCNDAISALFRLLKEKYQYVLRANVQKCFGSIDHNKLLNKLATFTQMENQVKIWLKIGIMGDYSERSNEVFRSVEGTPTYGVIAPLLINIALHGLENYIKDWYINNLCTSTRPNFKLTKQERKLTIGFSRYVDDFVITAPKREDIIQIESEISSRITTIKGKKTNSQFNRRFRILGLSNHFN
jgi:RNA-directed DNA polymerase